MWQTDGQTDGIAMVYTRYSTYAVARKNTKWHVQCSKSFIIKRYITFVSCQATHILYYLRQGNIFRSCKIFQVHARSSEKDGWMYMYHTMIQNLWTLSLNYCTDHNLGKWRPIFKILSLLDSSRYSLCSCDKDFHLTLTVLLYYLVKSEYLK